MFVPPMLCSILRDAALLDDPRYIAEPKLDWPARPGSHHGQLRRVLILPMMMDRATRLLIAALRRDADLHERGRADELGADFETLDAAPPADAVAWFFYDAWLDERNHSFPGFYNGISREMWPQLARRIADDLEAGRSISDPLLLEHFGPRRTLRQRIAERLRAWIARIV